MLINTFGVLVATAATAGRYDHTLARTAVTDNPITIETRPAPTVAMLLTTNNGECLVVNVAEYRLTTTGIDRVIVSPKSTIDLTRFLYRNRGTQRMLLRFNNEAREIVEMHLEPPGVAGRRVVILTKRVGYPS